MPLIVTFLTFVLKIIVVLSFLIQRTAIFLCENLLLTMLVFCDLACDF